ncbi:MAG: hypothetical protein JSU86_03020 [Phycisphaerales bacterium]|nr:MAG: hypothetical protein JSU86_03020 [Phycisphaerales bacterium]
MLNKYLRRPPRQPKVVVSDEETSPFYPVTLLEQYAALIAIHDNIYDDEQRIGPRNSKDAGHQDLFIQYRALLKEVAALAEQTEAPPWLEDTLADVTADMKSACPEKPGPPAPEAAVDANGPADAEEDLRTAVGKLVQELSDAGQPAAKGEDEERARAEEPSALIEQWETATKAAEIAKRVTGVNRDWSSYWRAFCSKHKVATRSGRKRTGEPTKYRREVEVGSLVRAIRQHPAEFEKATSESEKRRQAIDERIRREHGFTPEFREELLRPE